jgi:hypothetical protein
MRSRVDVDPDEIANARTCCGVATGRSSHTTLASWVARRWDHHDPAGPQHRVGLLGATGQIENDPATDPAKAWDIPSRRIAERQREGKPSKARF